MVRLREAPERNGVQRRYCEFRFDGNRTISGIAMRYGDVAKLPWGEKERFEPGAFGDISSADVLLNKQHQRSIPLARTGGGGLSFSDSSTELNITADLPETRDADDVIELVKKRILRGFSIEFLPKDYVIDREKEIVVVKKAKLLAVAIVDRPAYNQSTVNPREQKDMDEKKIQALIEAELDKRQGNDIDATALARSITESLSEDLESRVSEQVREQVAAALQERDDAAEAARQSEEDREKAERRAKAQELEMQKRSSERADLILSVLPLIPKTDTSSLSNQEILVLAVGDEVPDAKDRSVDYLRAKVEGILERRSQAQNRRQTQSQNRPVQRHAPGSALTNVLKLPGRPSPGVVRGVVSTQ